MFNFFILTGAEFFNLLFNRIVDIKGIMSARKVKAIQIIKIRPVRLMAMEGADVIGSIPIIGWVIETLFVIPDVADIIFIKGSGNRGGRKHLMRPVTVTVYRIRAEAFLRMKRARNINPRKIVFCTTIMPK